MSSLLINKHKNNDFTSLIEQPKELCVSIYMPIYGKKAEIQTNFSRLKNLLRQAQELLGANRRSPVLALKLLRPASVLLNDPGFWLSQDRGLVIFLADGIFHYYRLPLVFEELVVVATHFHFQPLFPLLTEAEQIRALSTYPKS
jgi:hypothetical protein